MTTATETHYGQEYYRYQAPMGEFGGWASIPKFKDFVSPTDTVLDFGCGGGFLLRNLDCARRVGVEVNPAAQDVARGNGIEVYPSTSDVADGSVDVVISNHALEHTRSPIDEVTQLHRVLRPGGRLVMVVPCESIFRRFRHENPDHHLFTWSPMCLGNLLTECGFREVESRAYMSRTPPKVHRLLARYGGRRVYDAASTVYGWLNPSLSQVRATGVK